METTPIENIIGLSDEFVIEFLDLGVIQLRSGVKSTVEFHKQKLGKHHRTFTGEFRFHVWTFGNWTIYVSDKKGVCFEVDADLTKEQALAAWKDYQDRMYGILPKETSS